MPSAIAIMGDYVFSDLTAVATHPSDLNDAGTWFVAHTFERDFLAFRFNQRDRLAEYLFPEPNAPIAHGGWKSSMSQDEYCAAVIAIKEDIARGWVYQANLCRTLSVPVAPTFNIISLYSALQQRNPAPHACALWVPQSESGLPDVAIASATPELFLSRSGSSITTSPIKGTAQESSGLQTKDHAENIMIVDLMRNDLSLICEPGSVHVPDLLRTEQHPGLVHLVSDISGTVRDDVSWSDIFELLSPPGSVSGAPKSSAVEVISRLEPVPRGFYCGVLGLIESDVKAAHLAVGIRTFWLTGDDDNRTLNFGTGAGITWGSDPMSEWHETQLKARHLLSIVSDFS